MYFALFLIMICINVPGNGSRVTPDYNTGYWTDLEDIGIRGGRGGSGEHLSEKSSSRHISLSRYSRRSDSLWSCFHLFSRGSECLGAIIDHTPCVNIAKSIFDILHTVINEHGEQACYDMINSAVSLPINAVGCATFGVGAVAEYFTGGWVSILLANGVALQMPGKLAAWLGCPSLGRPSLGFGRGKPWCKGRNYPGGNECCESKDPEDSKCTEGQGDCDSDAGCAGDLVCGSNNCRQYREDASPRDDCCTTPR